MASFGLVPDSKVLNGQNTVSNMGDIPRVDLSCLENIPEPAETLQIEGGLESLTKMVEYLTLKVQT